MEDLEKKMKVFVLSFEGDLQEGILTASQLEHCGADVTLIYSTPSDVPELANQSFAQCRADQSSFFGGKFAVGLNIAEGDSCLFVCADVFCSDWDSLLGRFRTHIDNPDIGVWAPRIEGTAWGDHLVRVRDFGNNHLTQVSQTDALVLGLSSEVVKRVRSLDFGSNSLGWGIDWACVAASMAQGLSVVRDSAITVTHTPGSAYSRTKAAIQQEAFLLQLSSAEKAIISLMGANHIVNRRIVRRFLKFVAFVEEQVRLLRRGAEKARK